MTITTEEAERLALSLEIANQPATAEVVRDLAAERDALRAEVERSESGVSYETFVSAMRIVTTERDALQAEKVNLQDDLASVERERAHQHGRADRNAAEYAREQKKREQLQAENARLREALKEYDDAYEDWFQFAAGGKDDPNEETKACVRLVKAQKVARAALGETQ
jgi:chromosome segregation ATPase